MSRDDENVCGWCGIAEVDNIKLEDCGGCDLVKYCSDKCRGEHRHWHAGDCKKRSAELHDKQLFTQPDGSYLGECPICCLPNPLEMNKSGIFSCCCKRICNGCDHANKQREKEQGLEHKCPYCREPLPKMDEEYEQNLMERAKANDPDALLHMGHNCHNEGDHGGEFEYYTKAAALGNAESHFGLALMYQKGESVGVEKDMGKAVYHLEEAAIGGHHYARYNLGFLEHRVGRIDRAVKHYIIAANLGYDFALEAVKKDFVDGYAGKEDYEVALRGYQAAVDATKSKQRDVAYSYYESLNQE